MFTYLLNPPVFGNLTKAQGPLSIWRVQPIKHAAPISRSRPHQSGFCLMWKNNRHAKFLSGKRSFTIFLVCIPNLKRISKIVRYIFFFHKKRRLVLFFAQVTIVPNAMHGLTKWFICKVGYLESEISLGIIFICIEWNKM